MLHCPQATLDIIASQTGSLADWTASSNAELGRALHARLRQIETQLGERDATLIDLLGRRGMRQGAVARMLGISQPSVSNGYKRAIRRARYWARLLDVSGEIARALRELRVERDHAELVLGYLTGTYTNGSSVPQSTAWDRIEGVRRVAERAGKRGSRRAGVLAEMIEMRRGLVRV